MTYESTRVQETGVEDKFCMDPLYWHLPFLHNSAHWGWTTGQQIFWPFGFAGFKVSICNGKISVKKPLKSLYRSVTRKYTYE